MPFKNLGGHVGKLIFESHIYLSFVIYFSDLNFFLPILFLFLQAGHQMFSAKQTKIKYWLMLKKGGQRLSTEDKEKP